LTLQPVNTRHLAYDLVALDVDGTILPASKELHPETKEVLHALSAKGVTIVIATGRRWRTAMDVIKPLGSGDYLIQSSGAVIRNIETADILFERYIPGSIAREIIGIGQDLGVTGVWYDTPRRTRKLYVFGKLTDVEALTQYASRNPSAFIEADNFKELADAMELVFFGDTDDLIKLDRKLRSCFSTSVRIMPWTNNPFSSLVLEVVDHETSKGSSLEWLSKYLEISRDRVLAIGDDINDLEMISWAGTGVAMGNANKALAALADVVIGTVDEQGAANYLRQLLS